MNKMIKMATIVAGVGAMLSFAGCGEKDPAKKAANIFREMNSVVAASGLTKDLPMPESRVAALENGTLTEEEKKGLLNISEKVASSMGLFKRYVAALKEVKSLDSTICKDLISDLYCIDRAEEFFSATPDQQKQAVEKVEKKLEQLKHLKAAMGMK